MSGYRIAAGKHRITQVQSIKMESPTVKTFTFEDKECARAAPGQFLMLWIPGVDEIPLSILAAGEDDLVSVAVKRVGEATRALHEKKVGEAIGIRGPFGNGFTLSSKRILMVGGGTGIAPLAFLAKRVASESRRMVAVLGAKTRDELLFLDRFKEIPSPEGARVVATTEDGSCGLAGLCTEPLESLLVEEAFDMIYACGPEMMIRQVFGMAKRHFVNLEASLERLMRCAIGLCGSCVVGKYRVCRDGPVFTAEQLAEFEEELGVSKRDFEGKKVPL